VLIVWSDDADDDLAEIAGYFISIDQQEHGYEVIRSLLRSANILKDSPMIGRDGRIDNTRELINTTFPYITIYRIVSVDVIRILGVIHTSRKFPKEL
jgi:plasmid stabilization system protein ParE